MPANSTIHTRTLLVGGAVLAVAVGAYLIGTTNRAVSPPQTVVYAVPAANQSSDSGLPGITVTGTGTVDGTPDTLILQLSVTETRSNVSDALSAASTTVNKIDSALTGLGVASADLQTTGASMQPSYQYGSSVARIVGYTASESLTATLRNLPGAGSQITAAVAAGGNATSIEGVSLDIENNSSLMSSARSAAFADAQTKAQQYASAAHETLGRAVQVTETVSSNPPEPLDASAAAAPSAANPAVPINAGTSQVSVTVTVVFSAS
jgi:uncharacterized protein YggE